MYGLAASAPGLKDISRMQHQLTRQARAITHLFAHLRKVSTQELHRRFHLSTVLDMLHKEAHALHHQLLTNDNLSSMFTVLLTLVVLATAEFPEGIKAAIPKGLQVKIVSQGVPFAHVVQG